VTADAPAAAAAPPQVAGASAYRRERRIVSLARKTRGLRQFLATPVDGVAAQATIHERVERRDELLLDSLRRLVFEVPQSPYRPLLDAAGCSYGDVEASVRDRGVEGTLEQLRDAGVYVTLDEWKGREPIARNGVELHVRPEHFDNPRQGAAVHGSSSGSSGGASRTSYGWEALADASASLRVTLDAFEIADAPKAIWLPAPPGGSGLVTAIILTKATSPPERWFTPTKGAGGLTDRLTTPFLLVASRALGHPLPRPRLTELGDAAVVARWLAAGEAPRALVGFASSAVRVAQVAQELGLDLTGRVVGVTGEPVTAERRALLAGAGMRVAAVYAASDAGGIGTGCPAAPAVEDYHLRLDRIALVPAADAPASGPVPTLLTSLLPTTAKVLLNVDIGDQALIERRPCGCLFGRLGLDVHLSSVQSRGAQTSEGMTVPSRVLWEHAGAVLASAGAGRDDYQIWEVPGEDGLSRVALVVSPHLEIDETLVVKRILDEFGRRDPGSKTAAEVWRQAGTLRVVRERPRLSAGGKLLPVIRVER
jgi:hypothetical protein